MKEDQNTWQGTMYDRFHISPYLHKCQVWDTDFLDAHFPWSFCYIQVESGINFHAARHFKRWLLIFNWLNSKPDNTQWRNASWNANAIANIPQSLPPICFWVIGRCTINFPAFSLLLISTLINVLHACTCTCILTKVMSKGRAQFHLS